MPPWPPAGPIHIFALVPLSLPSLPVGAPLGLGLTSHGRISWNTNITKSLPAWKLPMAFQVLIVSQSLPQSSSFSIFPIHPLHSNSLPCSTTCTSPLSKTDQNTQKDFLTLCVHLMLFIKSCLGFVCVIFLPFIQISPPQSFLPSRVKCMCFKRLQLPPEHLLLSLIRHITASFLVSQTTP
jgi:hypothetical protein